MGTNMADNGSVRSWPRKGRSQTACSGHSVASSSWSLRNGNGLKTRPILDYRMPTLANRTTLLLPLGDSARKPNTGLLHLDTHPPSSLKEVRHALTSEIKRINKKLTRLERAYYGIGKSVMNDVKKYAPPLKVLIRMLSYFELSSTKCIEAALKVGSEPKRYKGDPENVGLLKDVYAKVQKFVPGKFTEVAEMCEKILEVLERYCISFYDKDTHVEVETAAHYAAQIQTWGKVVRENLENIHLLYSKFKSRGIHYSMFSTPVTAFCRRYECELLPFLLLFAEGCTNIRSVISILNQWISSDENYSLFLQNDVCDLEHQKEEHVKVKREAQEKYHSLCYKLNLEEGDYTRLLEELESLKDKDDANETETKVLKEKLNEVEMDLEFKEERLEIVKLKADEITDESEMETLAITWDNLSEEIRYLKDRHPVLKRQLTAAQNRKVWMREKRLQLDKLEKRIGELHAEMTVADAERHKREAEYETIDKTLDYSRRLHQYKTSNDSLEKIFYEIPVTTRNAKLRLPKISNGTDGMLDKVCNVVIDVIGQDWMQLYRHLPFVPKRGAETIEKDIASISDEGVRGPKEDIIKHALARWRRHHTRARADDLKHGLKAIGRLDLLREVELTMNPPPKTPPTPEYIPAGLDPSLVPFYREVVKFDELCASNKFQILQLQEDEYWQKHSGE